MDVALSKGEYVIEPEEAQRIGYDTLNKINDQGKAEVDRRQGLHRGGVATHRHTKDPVEPLELEYVHGKSEFDGTYIRPPLSPEAQAPRIVQRQSGVSECYVLLSPQKIVPHDRCSD